MSDYLAVERTFLAWIRTGLALMGFGFVVARFGLFLQRLRLLELGMGGGTAPGAGAADNPHGISTWFGTSLILIGVITTLFACWRHAKLIAQLNEGGVAFTRPSRAALALGVFLALVGAAMAVYLISV